MPVRISKNRVALENIPLNEAATVIVASAASTAIGAAASNNVDISGTTTITSFDTVAEGINRKGRFTGALTLTHNATSLILPGAANITTAANDRYEARSLGSGNWIVTKYQKADGTAVVSTAAVAATQAQIQDESSNTVFATPSNLKYRLGCVDPETKFEFYEDFEHQVTTAEFGKSAWTVTGGALAIITGRGGIARFSEISAANIDITLRGSDISTPFNSAANPIFKCRMANYGTDGGIRRIGLVNEAPYTTTYHGFQLTWTPGANLILRSRAGGAESTLDSGVVMETGGTFHKAKFVVTDGVSVALFVDGVAKGTITTNLPTNAALLLWLLLTGSLAGNGIDVDYIQVVQDR